MTMSSNWEDWRFEGVEGTPEFWGCGVYQDGEFELFVQAYEYQDQTTVRRDVDKIVEWVKGNTAQLREVIVSKHYASIIWTFCLGLEKVASLKELQAIYQERGHIKVKPFASEANMLKYLQPWEIAIGANRGFSVEFTARGEPELESAMGGHGPTIEVGHDFTISELGFGG